jgi:hypothetical protein
LVAVEPPAPQVTVTKSGRRACDMRSSRVVRLAKPYIAMSIDSRAPRGKQTMAVFGGKNSREK